MRLRIRSAVLICIWWECLLSQSVDILDFLIICALDFGPGAISFLIDIGPDDRRPNKEHRSTLPTEEV